MRALPTALRGQLESAVLAGRRAGEAGVRAALGSLGVQQESKPAHLNEGQARLRRGLRAKQRQLGGGFEVLVWECAYEQWHRLLFARFLAENGLLRHPEFGAPVTLDECEELASDLGEPDGWSLAARFAAEILPGIFRLDDPCVQLRLAPEHRVALENIVAGLPGEMFAADDSLGWVYQYWQMDRKHQVNTSEVKIGGADLGPVTQLFTENYMVRFLLENSLGAWWAARQPHSPLLEGFEYLRFDLDGQPAAGTFDGWPDRVAEVTIMDPCCGSGHFLVEAFRMLWLMRAEEDGLDPVAAQDAVLRDNLFGLELDPRCVQIAMFAVALTAWKQGGGWRELPIPNIGCSGIPVKAPLVEWTALAGGDYRLEQALERLHTLFKDADTLGSLIDPRHATEFANSDGVQRSLDDVAFEDVLPVLDAASVRETDDPATAVLGADASGIACAASLLSNTYTLIVTNTPFLSRFKQTSELRSFLDRQMQLSKGDLATAMLERWMTKAHTVALVSPQNWQENPGYTEFRKRVLQQTTYNLFARVGNNVWQTQSGRQPYKVSTLLSILTYLSPLSDHSIKALDIGNGPNSAKPRLLVRTPVTSTLQRENLLNPDSRIVTNSLSRLPPLKSIASAKQGIKTGDDLRYRRLFWEVPLPDTDWIYCQSSVVNSCFYGGRSTILFWENGTGSLAKNPGARIQGREAWGRKGVLVSQMGDLFATLYTGEVFDSNAAAVIPHNPSDLPTLWAFLSSPSYRRAVRELDNNVKVTNRTLVKVSFDVDHWTQKAEQASPLPTPSSNNPTQWLFDGFPDKSTAPLHVAVGRLVGYRWPEQPMSDNLDGLGDRDGILCLPAVAGELPAADRLQALLAEAWGDDWSPGLVRQLLDQAASSKKDLADWLHDEFFAQHCRVFLNRPFVWQVWDGRRDGFSALVNYHRLDRTGLEKLTYTYLGDWIERQRADASDEVAGADARLTVARELKANLEAILEGEPPYDVYVRWKPLHEQPIGWDPDLDDGVRLNIRPFVEAGVLRSKVNVHWRKDRGMNPDGSERQNDLHYTRAEKQHAREKAAKE